MLVARGLVLHFATKHQLIRIGPTLQKRLQILESPVPAFKERTVSWENRQLEDLKHQAGGYRTRGGKRECLYPPGVLGKTAEEVSQPST